MISQQLQVDSALDNEESEIQTQFSKFVHYLGLYAKLDEQVYRIYASATDEAESFDTNELTSPHWLTNENTCISFFASISQFAPNDESEASRIKRDRTELALSRLLAILTAAPVGSDPLYLTDFENIRRGGNARKVNIGSYTRRALANGFKEFYRSEGEITLSEAWNLAVD